MIAELNIGHTYVYGGDSQSHGEPPHTGLLGCDFAVDRPSGRIRIARILPGRDWDPSARSPLAEPGVNVHQGDFLLAVDGRPLAAGGNPYELLADRAGRLVELTVADNPEGKQPRTVLVQPLRGEGSLRYRAWVEANRRTVDEKSGGRLGYLHLPDMGEPGLVEFGAYWYPQSGKQGFIIDERDNGGGFVGDMIIDRLERVLWSMTIPREGGPGRNPERVFHGPLAVLISEDTGSNGEFFASAIRFRGLAPLIGMRTWGGATGIEPHQDLVDGGTVTPPQFGLYGMDGKWGFEGHGVDPDIQVQNMPARVVAGQDDQLDAAIKNVLDRLAGGGSKWAIPPVPAYPDKSKPGEGVKK
jgi:tricorn protease